MTVGLEDWRPDLHGTATKEGKQCLCIRAVTINTYLLNRDTITFL